MEAPPVQRPGSIRSVASNSSIVSGVSLSRQPRTRMRSRTVTGATESPEGPPATPSDLPYLSGHFVQEPLEDLTNSSREPLTGPPPRPPRSPQRLEAVEIRGSDTASSQGATDPDPTFVEPLPSGPISAKASKAIKQASTLPPLDTGYRPPPSAFSRDPALTPITNVRDSVSTQQSGVSSSLYPPSTSTASLPESPPSPRSIAGQMDPPPFALEVSEVQEYDSDDVSYRLRLLVKNNYFLPPAHSKPSPADFAPPPLNVPKKSPRTAGPFLDLFRVGKSKSKPTTPTGPTSGFDPTLPMLRTTSDSITAPYALRTNQPRPSAQFPHASPHISNPAPRGRVVVVREKMNDIAVAAKQAEQDLKARGVWIEQGSQKGNPIIVDDVIDPTDAVDIPLPSPSYPFAVQTSAMHGLGVLESVGAGVLADRLPPAKNPNLPVSYDPVEDKWRKALLHEAVHLSLDNTADESTFSHNLRSSTPLSSPRSNGPDTRVNSPPIMTTQQLIQQKIVAQPLIDVTSSIKHSRQKSNESTSKGNTSGKLAVLTVETRDTSRPSSYQRVETPSGPMTPLGPPPRRHFVNPLYSLSQTDLTNDYQPPNMSSALSEDDLPPALRRTVSSPLLSEGYNSSSSSRHSVMTPPPVPQYSRDSQVTITSFNTVRGDETIDGVLSDSHESDFEDLPRNSLALSAMMSRPSLSEYSQDSLSPTTSTFQDMINHESHSAASTHPGPSRFSLEQQSGYRSSPSNRSMAMSPPPRMSSSLAHVALPPPPRSLSFNYQTVVRSHLSSSASSSQSNRSPPAGSGDSTFHITAPEPTTPPLPLVERQNRASPPPISVDISSDFNPASVRIDSAPGPSSPTSFFDSIQSQPNAMDDLESSSDESDDEEPNPIPPKLFVDPRTRATSNTSAINPRPQIMKHGNFSTPYIRPGESYHHNLLPVGNDAHSRQPVSNKPIRLAKNDTLPSSSYDFFQYAQDNPPNLSDLTVENSLFRRPSTGEHVMNWRNNQRAQDSLRKLDGMLLQHMEDEKDTIKRIATHMKQTTNSQPSPSNLPPR
ncbi:hypothetical protein GALMADRAFT_156407 [Galerina marginata CBS 339.88]|uniref:Uncharacterized protein n=1 Tax=Galerina marginata (strain CBS 339.88) TaxID=685588 RepID=A0A067T8T3_GALM3|nr:hypothetical protein GALMADRAFT_156407 [Galerina marginata CBS 339.88]